MTAGDLTPGDYAPGASVPIESSVSHIFPRPAGPTTAPFR